MKRLTPLLHLTHLLRRGLAAFGRGLTLMPLAMIVVEFIIIILLYFFAGETVRLEESLRYINALMFLGAAGGVFLVDGHVRVDIFYERASPRHRAITDCLGIVFFLLPFAVFFFLAATPFIRLGWVALEGSTETGGLPFVYILKSLLWLLPITLILAAGVRLVELVPVALGRNPSPAAAQEGESS